MKKWIALLLSAVLMLSLLAGCGGGEDTPVTPDTPSNPSDGNNDTPTVPMLPMQKFHIQELIHLDLQHGHLPNKKENQRYLMYRCF